MASVSLVVIVHSQSHGLAIFPFLFLPRMQNIHTTSNSLIVEWSDRKKQDYS